VGFTAGSAYGNGVFGGVQFLFGDQLNDRLIQTTVSANGGIRDLGGSVMYYDMRNRWNWGAGVMHAPFVTGYATLGDTVVRLTPTVATPAYNVYYVFQRIYQDQASAFTSYPFSTTRRAELSGAVTRLSFQSDIVRQTYVGNQVVADARETGERSRPFIFAEPAAALVGDNSIGGYTGPIAGEVYRLELRPTIGTYRFTTALADYRRYMLRRPFTLAVRGFHMGRYGRDEQNEFYYPMFLGEGTWVRGYSYSSWEGNECLDGGGNGVTTCPGLDRLFGTRVLLANAELRIPLLGIRDFALLPFPFIPVDVAPFFDAGVAYTGGEDPQFRFARTAGTAGCPAAQSRVAPDGSISNINCTERIPVMSTGVSFRFNMLGYLVLEAYLAHPFQRPQRNWIWGFNLAPAW
jgi:hypothetical protein